jgi:3-dehydroquinate dehydratase
MNDWKLMLTIQEIKNLDDTELGKQIAEIVGYKTQFDEELQTWEITRKSELTVISSDFLCQSLDAIAKVERIIIEEDLEHSYLIALEDAIALNQNSYFVTQISKVTAMARQRAEACLYTLKKRNF